MKYLALATDYDGTIAHDGIVDAPTLAALDRWLASGRKLILVTGRELDDLFRTYAHVDRFHRVVAENGALLYTPSTQAVRVVAPSPPHFLDDLARRGVPVSVGRSIVATVVPHEVARRLGVSESRLHEWKKAIRANGTDAFPGSGHHPPWKKRTAGSGPRT